MEPNDGVDVTLIQWMLSLTPAERLDALQSSVDDLWIKEEVSDKKNQAILPIPRRVLEEIRRRRQ